MDDQNALNTDEELKEIKDRLKDLEKAVKQGASIGVTMSRMQCQLDELSLQVKGLRIVSKEALQKSLPGFDLDKKVEEACNDLRKTHETSGEADYLRW